MPILTRVEGLDVVGYYGNHPQPLARVGLLEVAAQLAAKGHKDCARVGAADFAALDGTTHVQVGSLRSFVKKAKRKLKSVVKKVLKVASKIVKSKLFQVIASTVAMAIPPPFGEFVTAGMTVARQAANAIHKIKSSPLAQKLIPHIQAAAHGQLHPDELARLAPQAGLSVAEAHSLAAVTKLRAMAPFSTAAAGTLGLMGSMYRAHAEASAGKAGPHLLAAAVHAQRARVALVKDAVTPAPHVEAELHKTHPHARAYTVVRGGKRFNAILVPQGVAA